MQRPEEELIALLKKAGLDFTASLPCEKIKRLLGIIGETFPHVPLSREEEGVGICAGAALSGKRPALFVQSSGIGNMINALLSLTGFYELPLSLFISWRGVYKEKIEAQMPMGRRLPLILEGAGLPCIAIKTRDDFGQIRERLPLVYSKSRMHAFLLSPEIWEGTYAGSLSSGTRTPAAAPRLSLRGQPTLGRGRRLKPHLSRFDTLRIIAPYLDSRAVVCNLGFPSKELYYIKHQPSNFYMLGSMGMATPIGIGIALTSEKQVIVIDGDGSLLMNPGSLGTAGFFSPRNLTIIAIDNGSYGSTGDQPTFTQSCVDLELVARGFGIKKTYKVADEKDLTDSLKTSGKGLTFIHVLAVAGNRDVPNIPLSHSEIKNGMQDFLRTGGR